MARRMHQTQLDQFLTPKRSPFVPSGLNFLHLPYPVRRLVYYYTEITDNLIDLNFSHLKYYSKGTYPDTLYQHHCSYETWWALRKVDADELDDVWELDDEYDEGCRRGFQCLRLWNTASSLLLTSREINEEVENLLYGENTFRVCRGNPLGFRRLWRMSDRALAALSSLTVRLDVPQDFVDGDGWLEYPLLPTPLDLKSRYGKLVLKDWNTLIKNLARVGRLRHLRLYVVFRAVDMDVVKAVIESMMTLPILKDCGIWVQLGRGKERSKPQEWNQQTGQRILPQAKWKKDEELSTLVHQTIARVTGRSVSDGFGFRYLDLPQEIRLMILEYSDLLGTGDVYWRPQKKRPRNPYPPFYCTCSEYLGFRMLESNDECICEPTKALGEARMDSEEGDMDDWQSWDICCGECMPDDQSQLCLCFMKGSTFSSSCSCRQTRHPLFAVSHKVREDAIATYYSQNRIIIVPYETQIVLREGLWEAPWWPSRGVYGMKKVELSLYIPTLAPTAFQFIRWLEWVLPSFPIGYLGPKTPAWHNYLDTLELMKHAMNVQNLTFIVNLSASGLREDHSEYYDYRYVERLAHMPLDIRAWRNYDEIIFPIGELGAIGLKDFFVYLRRHDLKPHDRIYHERRLEKMVMGGNYDSSNRGKPEERFARMEYLCRRRWDYY